MSATVTLAEFSPTRVWHTSIGRPTGETVEADVIDARSRAMQLPGDDGPGTGLSPWWQLRGAVDGDGRWQWDGHGEPSDWHSNTVLRIVAYRSR